MQITELITNSTKLRDYWVTRNRKFKDWYNILRLQDDMVEDNKESFVSNRPRTFFNLSLHLLDSPTIPHKYPVEGLTDEEIQATSTMENNIQRIWKHINKKFKRMGRQSATRLLASHILSFGWYAVYADTNADEPHLEVWHPADVFPCYSETGLMSVAHIYNVPNNAAKMMYKLAGLSPGHAVSGDVKIYDYWWHDDNGAVSHAIATSKNHWLLEPTTRPDLLAIPVCVGPVGGLSDMGQLDTNWQEHNGESIVAVNEFLYKNYNRVKSFLQQATRDGTEPKWFERSTGTEILTEEAMKIAGAIFRGGPQDSVEPIAYPPIAVELTQNIFAYEQEIQEASFSSMMFGSVQMQVAAYTLSQMAQSAQQVLRPYHESFQDALEYVDNFYIYQMKETGFKPLGITVPALPNIEIEVNFPIAIPGDLINRATVAKMLAPNLEFSSETVMDLLFPAEIQNPLAETARARANRALNSEVSIMVDQAEAYDAQAELADKAGNSRRAQRYTAAADAIDTQLTGASQPPPTTQPPGGPPMGMGNVGNEPVPPGVA